jgi:HSP20 family protein
MWSPSIDISERDGKMIVHADLPGLSKDDVKVEMTEDSLTIQGERKREHEEQGKGFHRSERSYGSFYRCVPLPRGAQTESAQARFENGVLEISVPVPDESQKRRQIPVEAGNAERKNAASEGGAQKRESKAG